MAILEPSEIVIDRVLETLLQSIAEANKDNHQLRCKNLADPNAFDVVQLAEHQRTLQSAQALMKRAIQRRRARAQRCRNALQLVNRLPHETLGIIFHQLLATYSVFSRSKPLCTLILVSARWKFVVDSTPSLWSFIHSAQPKSQLERALISSGTTYLSVGCKTPGQVLTAGSKDRSRKFLQDVLSWGRSIDELTLHLPSIGHLQCLHSTPLHFLRKLEIRVGHASTQPVKLFDGSYSLLEDLKLTEVLVDWTCKTLTRLQVLTLAYKSTGPSTDELLPLLKHSPDLRSFSFDGGIYNDGSTDDTITLHHLVKLSLKETGRDAAITLLKSIQAPSCSHLTIHCISKHDYTLLFKQMERFLPSLRQSLQHAASISICLAPSSFHYHSIPTYPESPSRLDFELASFLPAQRSHIALDWLSEHLHGSGITTPPIDLHFEFGFDFTRDDRILTYFSRLESVTSLKVADRVVGPCRLLEWLSEQPTPSCTWGFPNLINLEIGPSNLLLWDIMKMGRKRYGTEEGPTKLKSFVVVGNEWPDVELMPEAIHRAFPGVECSHERASWKHMVCKINVDTEGDSRNDEEQDDAVSETSWQVDSETTDETGNSSVEESTSSNEMDTDDG